MRSRTDGTTPRKPPKETARRTEKDQTAGTSRRRATAGRSRPGLEERLAPEHGSSAVSDLQQMMRVRTVELQPRFADLDWRKGDGPYSAALKREQRRGVEQGIQHDNDTTQSVQASKPKSQKAKDNPKEGKLDETDKLKTATHEPQKHHENARLNVRLSKELRMEGDRLIQEARPEESFEISQGKFLMALERYRQSLQLYSPPDALRLSETIEAVAAERKERIDRKHQADGEALKREGRIADATSKYREGLRYRPDEQLKECVDRLEAGLTMAGDLKPQDKTAERSSPVTLPQSIPSIAAPRVTSPSLRTAAVRNGNVYQLIQVRYRNGGEGYVDDVTLDELIESKRIKHFYRPSESRWVDTAVDPVRQRAAYPPASRHEEVAKGFLRRASDWGGEDEPTERQEPVGFFRKLFKNHSEPTPLKKLTAQQWFEKGFVMLYTSDDCAGAVRAFALAIRLNPTHERAYVGRALAYTRLDNLQQAVEDYSKATELTPDDPKVYYLRGLALRRLGMGTEAVKDLRHAAGMAYRPAWTFLKSIGVPS